MLLWIYTSTISEIPGVTKEKLVDKIFNLAIYGELSIVLIAKIITKRTHE